MADNTNGLAQLELIRQWELSERETNILHAFGLAMRSGVSHAAAEAASRLDALCPPLEWDQEAGDYIWRVSGVMFGIAASPDVTEQVHFVLVAVLQELAQTSRAYFDIDEVCSRVTFLNQPSHVSGNDHSKPTFGKCVWEELSGMAASFYASYGDSSYCQDEETEQRVQNWYKQAIFGARALAALCPWSLS